MGLFGNRISKAEQIARVQKFNQEWAESQARWDKIEGETKRLIAEKKRSEDEAKVKICNEWIQRYLSDSFWIDSPFDIDAHIAKWQVDCDIPITLSQETTEVIDWWKKSNEYLREIMRQSDTSIFNVESAKSEIEQSAGRALRIDDDTMAMYEALQHREQDQYVQAWQQIEEEEARNPSGNSMNLEKALESIDDMDGHDFEYFCAALLRNLGYQDVQVTQGSGDQGIDVIASRDSVKYGIQCKRYSSDVGNGAIQEAIAGKQFYGCHVGLVLTNQFFTPAAQQLASATGIVLWDRNKLIQLMKSRQEEK